MPISDRRKHARVRKKLRLVFHKKRFFFLWGFRDTAEVVDISKGGMQINTRMNLKIRNRVVLLVMPRNFTPTVHLPGKVVWVRALEHEGRRYKQAGIAFGKLGPVQRASLGRMI